MVRQNKGRPKLFGVLSGLRRNKHSKQKATGTFDDSAAEQPVAPFLESRDPDEGVPPLLGYSARDTEEIMVARGGSRSAGGSRRSERNKRKKKRSHDRRKFIRSNKKAFRDPEVRDEVLKLYDLIKKVGAKQEPVETRPKSAFENLEKSLAELEGNDELGPTPRLRVIKCPHVETEPFGEDLSSLDTDRGARAVTAPSLLTTISRMLSGVAEEEQAPIPHAEFYSESAPPIHQTEQPVLPASPLEHLCTFWATPETDEPETKSLPPPEVIDSDHESDPGSVSKAPSRGSKIARHENLVWSTEMCGRLGDVFYDTLAQFEQVHLASKLPEHREIEFYSSSDESEGGEDEEEDLEDNAVSVAKSIGSRRSWNLLRRRKSGDKSEAGSTGSNASSRFGGWRRKRAEKKEQKMAEAQAAGALQALGQEIQASVEQKRQEMKLELEQEMKMKLAVELVKKEKELEAQVEEEIEQERLEREMEVQRQVDLVTQSSNKWGLPRDDASVGSRRSIGSRLSFGSRKGQDGVKVLELPPQDDSSVASRRSLGSRLSFGVFGRKRDGPPKDDLSLSSRRSVGGPSHLENAGRQDSNPADRTPPLPTSPQLVVQVKHTKASEDGQDQSDEETLKESSESTTMVAHKTHGNDKEQSYLLGYLLAQMAFQQQDTVKESKLTEEEEKTIMDDIKATGSNQSRQLKLPSAEESSELSLATDYSLKEIHQLLQTQSAPRLAKGYLTFILSEFAKTAKEVDREALQRGYLERLVKSPSLIEGYTGGEAEHDEEGDGDAEDTESEDDSQTEDPKPSPPTVTEETLSSFAGSKTTVSFDGESTSKSFSHEESTYTNTTNTFNSNTTQEQSNEPSPAEPELETSANRKKKIKKKRAEQSVSTNAVPSKAESLRRKKKRRKKRSSPYFCVGIDCGGCGYFDREMDEEDVKEELETIATAVEKSLATMRDDKDDASTYSSLLNRQAEGEHDREDSSLDFSDMEGWISFIVGSDPYEYSSDSDCGSYGSNENKSISVASSYDHRRERTLSRRRRRRHKRDR